MIVDDEVDITDALKAGLERRGFKVETFNDPREALAMFRLFGFDISLLDVRMPEMNGFELYREMRKVDEEASVCFLTAFDIPREEFEVNFPYVKGKTILKKPITTDDIAANLNKLLPKAEHGRSR